MTDPMGDDSGKYGVCKANPKHVARNFYPKNKNRAGKVPENHREATDGENRLKKT